ncbi:MAG: dihydrodipicolinate synthase family protein [Anaerolineae bacterium]
MIDTLQGLFAASITPFHADGALDRDGLITHLHRLHARGCHGVLLCGTTGEGPSLTVEERITVFKTAVEHNPGLTLLAGTGAVSLNDTITLTRAAYETGCTAAVVLPPFFFPRDIDLFATYKAIIQQAVPTDAPLLLYHNPKVTQVHLDLALIARLQDSFGQIAGIKDSSGSWERASALIERGLIVFVGDDRLLLRTLEAGGAGAITGAANLFAVSLRAVYDAHHSGQEAEQAQQALNDRLSTLDGLPRIAAIKHLAGSAAVRLPLRELTPQERAQLAQGGHHVDSSTDTRY